MEGMMTCEELVHTPLLGAEALDWVIEQFKHHQLESVILYDGMEPSTFKVIYQKKIPQKK